MFSVSTRVRYALRALQVLAKAEAQELVTISRISGAENISQKYLENIFRVLRKNRIVIARRGPEGGYILNRPAESITLFEILSALEGPLGTSECVETDGCEKHTSCVSRNLWCDLTDHISIFFKQRTLADLVHQDVRKVEHPGIVKGGSAYAAGIF